MSPHALVTGAAGDIGSAIVRRLVGAGHTVTAVDTADERRTLARFANLEAGSVLARSADVTDADSISDLIDSTPPVDVLVGNAGIVRPSTFLDMSVEDWSATLAVNLTANAVLGQLVARSMVARGAGGRIVYTGSWVGSVPWPGITSYAVSKAGLEMLAKQMARELAEHGILVNVVAPGIVDAGLAGNQLRTDPEYAARAARVVPLGKFQTPEQVAAAVAYLVSADADYVTGTVLLVDGGASLHQVDPPGE